MSTDSPHNQLKINILLSTFNGDKFVLEQLQSLYMQTCKGIKIYVRDDGSTDQTLQILKREADLKKITLIEGQNIGVISSYFELLKHSKDADFIAFCDQDDIWLPGKVSSAISSLSKIQGPALYCSSLSLVDQNLSPLFKFEYDDHVGFERSLFTNCATGCTCVINSELLIHLDKNPNINKIIMHDWWLYILASALGTVVYDSNSHILYRQHGQNQIGLKHFLGTFIQKSKLFFNQRPMPNRFSQMAEFLSMYGNKLSDDKKVYLETLLVWESNIISRFFIAFNLRPKRKSFIKNISSFIFVVLGH